MTHFSSRIYDVCSHSVVVITVDFDPRLLPGREGIHQPRFESVWELILFDDSHALEIYTRALLAPPSRPACPSSSELPCEHCGGWASAWGMGMGSGSGCCCAGSCCGGDELELECSA